MNTLHGIRHWTVLNSGVTFPYWLSGPIDRDSLCHGLGEKIVNGFPIKLQLLTDTVVDVHPSLHIKNDRVNFAIKAITIFAIYLCGSCNLGL